MDVVGADAVLCCLTAACSSGRVLGLPTQVVNRFWDVALVTLGIEMRGWDGVTGERGVCKRGRRQVREGCVRGCVGGWVGGWGWVQQQQQQTPLTSHPGCRQVLGCGSSCPGGGEEQVPGETEVCERVCGGLMG